MLYSGDRNAPIDGLALVDLLVLGCDTLRHGDFVDVPSLARPG